MRKLFVSFTGTLMGLKEGTVSENDLDTGLFYLGCSREHALDPWKHETNEVMWFWKDDPEKGRAVHARLAAALMQGEQEDRVLWKRKGELQGYEVLNELLAYNDIGIVSVSEGMYDHYNYQGVKEKIAEADLQLEVVY